MKKIDKNSRILFIIAIIFLVFIVGVSFALPSFIVNLKGTRLNKLDSCNFDISLSDENSINLVNAYPMSDGDALLGTPYVVTLTKSGNCNDYNYVLNMESICDTCTKTDGKCTVGDNTCDCNNQISSNLIRYYVKNNSTGEEYIGNDPYNMNITGKLNNESITFDILLWIDKDASNDDLIDSDGNYKDFCSKLGVGVSNDLLIDKISSQVKTMNISYKYINDANITENGITYNNGDNGVFLYDGTDDNGGSNPIYYYRGNVDNNNVLFGGFCWKIVRTTSTGGIKLIYNGVPSNGTCNNTGAASQLENKSYFNNLYNSPADVGYMYGERYTVSTKKPSGTILYGNDITYSNGTYTLSGKTMTSTSWSDDRTTLANGYHYTCFNETDTCTSVYYIIYFGDSSKAYYLTFTGGIALDSAKDAMFTNAYDSKIKSVVDNWYSTNLITYADYLENTIFCNDRTNASDEAYTVTRFESSYTENGGALSSKDINAVSFSIFKSYENTGKGTPSLQCSNLRDRFSLNTVSGGTSGYGNNALTYPVGILTSDEIELAGSQYKSNSNYYLYTGYEYWTLSPSDWGYGDSRVGYVSGFGSLSRIPTNNSSFGVRPSVSLKSGTTISSGDGTVDSPYTIS